MSVASRRSSRPAGADPGPVEAMTVDLWYTLIYVRAAERRRIELERRHRWLDLLERAGTTPTRARAVWSSVQRWADAEEKLGRAPTVAQQARRAAALTRRPVDANGLAEALDEVIRHADVHDAPGAAAGLRQLRDRGLRVGLVSNIVHESSAAAQALLERTPFAPLVETVQFSSDLPWSKPHPGPYRRALEALRTASDRAVHVGDQEIDRRGAESAGMRWVLYTGLWRWAYPGNRSPGPPRAPASLRAATWPEVVERVGSMAADAARGWVEKGPPIEGKGFARTTKG